MHRFPNHDPVGEIPWRIRDFAAIGSLAGLLLTLIEALDRTIVLSDFFSSAADRLSFFMFSFPSLLGTTVIGVCAGWVYKAVAWLLRLGSTPGRSSGAGSSRVAAALKILLASGAFVAIVLVLRPTLRAILRVGAAKLKGPVRRHAPEAFDYLRNSFEWVRAHPFVVLALVLAVVIPVGWRLSRSKLARRIRLTKTAALVLLFMTLVLTGIAYGLDSRYYFSIYARSVHLPLFLAELALSIIAIAAFYRLARPTLRIHARRVGLACIALSAVLSILTIVQLGRDESLKALFWGRSVIARRFISMLRTAKDFDRDGFSSILGGGDCDDGNPNINPIAREIPGNGIDENCHGGDLELQRAVGSGQRSGAPEDLNSESTHGASIHRSPTSDRQPLTADLRPLASRKPRNILLITIDALRADHLGCYGYRRPTSPNLDRFAKQGQLFLSAYSQGTNTGHSFCSMLRSAYGESIFDDDRPTFIEVLAQHGYATAFFNAKRTEKWLRGRTWERYKPTLLKGVQIQARTGGQGQWSAQRITKELIEHLQSAPRDAPAFIWAHYLEPHAPYREYPDLDFGSRAEDRYDGEIAYTDRALGKLFQFLAESEAWRNALVIVSADHGEAFFEHGEREHSSRPYQEEIHVPLLMRHPDIPTGLHTEPVGLIDLGPTIISFAGLESPMDYEGFDLSSPPRESGRAIVSETPRNLPEPAFYQWAMIQGSWKLIYDLVGNTFELYDLADDPAERKNLVNAQPAKAREMKAKFGHWLDRQSLSPVRSGDWSLMHILRR